MTIRRRRLLMAFVAGLACAVILGSCGSPAGATPAPATPGTPAAGSAASGTPAATGSAAPATSGPATPASPTPAATPNPVRSAAARQTLAYIESVGMSGDIMVGQQFTQGMDAEDPVFGYPGMVEALRNQTGRYPYIIGADLFLSPGYSSASVHDVNTYLIKQWQRGGLATVSTSFRNPWTGGTPWDRTLAHLPDLWTPGNGPYERFHKDLDLVAAGFKELEDAGVVVLYRPFHEMTGDWTWWGGWGQADYSSLWRHVHDYLTITKGLSNLLWVYAPNMAYRPNYPAEGYYPGGDVVDVVGLDWYSDTFPDELGRGDYDALVALGKPIALTEVGPWYQGTNHGGSLDDMRFLTAKQLFPKLSYFMTWTDWEGVTVSLVGNLNAKKLMNSPNAITLPGG